MSNFGNEEPGIALMSLKAYWQLRKYFEPSLKLPRKMKKRYLGTRAQNRRAFTASRKWHKRNVAFTVESEITNLEVY